MDIAGKALCAVQIVYVLWLTRDLTAFSLQVRVAYLAMLIVGLWGPLHWIHWMQLAGTTARVLIGYCLLARTLSLAPWNRRQPWSLNLIMRTFLSFRTSMPAYSEVFCRISLEPVQG